MWWVVLLASILSAWVAAGHWMRYDAKAARVTACYAVLLAVISACLYFA